VNERASVLLVNHSKKQRCGVYQFGLQIGKALPTSARYSFSYAECANEDDYRKAIGRFNPAVVIHNHTPTTMPWLRRGLMRRARAVQMGVIHEVTQAVADGADDQLFEFHVAPDPTLVLRNPIVFKTGRLVPAFQNRRPPPSVPTIGSFGFGTQGKGFDTVIALVQEEFDEAVIRLHIPFADFGDGDGRAAKAIAERCRGLVTKPKVRIELSHEFFTNDQLLDFLAGNSLNAFLYEEKQTGRGISSVVDYALAVRRPIAVSHSMMFRHLHDARPPVTYEDARLRDILARGFAPLAGHADAWTPAALVRDYEQIVTEVLEARRRSQPRTVLGRMGQSIAWEADSFARETKLRISRSGAATLLRQSLDRHPAVRRRLRALRNWTGLRARGG
jgi:hypothetical protein